MKLMELKKFLRSGWCSGAGGERTIELGSSQVSQASQSIVL